MPIKITATPTTGRALKPGQLFSNGGPEYWTKIHQRGSIGEQVYIRTDFPCDDISDADMPVYLITIEGDNS